MLRSFGTLHGRRISSQRKAKCNWALFRED
jgi:hypothetical protein